MNSRRFRGSALPFLQMYFDADKGGAGASGDSSAEPKTDNDADGGGKEPDGAGEKKFTQAELDAEIAKRLARKEAQQKQAADAAEEERKRKEAEAAGEWQKVNEQLKAENDRLKSEKAALEHAQLQAKVATDVGLPLQLADRLKGDDEATMAEDARAILKLLPKPATEMKPVTTGTKGNPPPKGTIDADKDAQAALENQKRLYRAI